MPALDRYDNRDIDDEEVGETFEAREAARLGAEREMDRAQGVRRTRLPAALLEGEPPQQPAVTHPFMWPCQHSCACANSDGSMTMQGLADAGTHLRWVLRASGTSRVLRA